MKSKPLIIPAITTMTSLELVLLINKLRQEESNTTELLHKSFLAKIESEFEEEIREQNILPSQYKQKMPTGGVKDVKKYDLNKTQSLQMLMSESKTVRRAVITYIEKLEKENLNLRNELQLKEKARDDARLEYKPMSTALKETRALLGKDTQHYHYSNEANLINIIVMGNTAKKLKEDWGLDNLDNLRDELTPQQIAAVQDLQKVNTSLIDVCLSYDERKEKLNALFSRKWSEALIEEHIKITA